MPTPHHRITLPLVLTPLLLACSGMELAGVVVFGALVGGGIGMWGRAIWDNRKRLQRHDAATDRARLELAAVDRTLKRAELLGPDDLRLLLRANADAFLASMNGALVVLQGKWSTVNAGLQAERERLTELQSMRRDLTDGRVRAFTEDEAADRIARIDHSMAEMQARIEARQDNRAAIEGALSTLASVQKRLQVHIERHKARARITDALVQRRHAFDAELAELGVGMEDAAQARVEAEQAEVDRLVEAVGLLDDFTHLLAAESEVDAAELVHRLKRLRKTVPGLLEEEAQPDSTETTP